MEYIKRELGSYKLHMIKTDKFKTIKVKVSFRRPILKEEVTMRNILSQILVQTTNKYKTKRDLAIKAQDLYAASISSSNSRIGNYINTDIILSVLNDKYTEEGNFSTAIDFLYDIIYDPNVDDNSFDKNQLEIIKTSAKTELESEKEDSNYYSILRLHEIMDANNPSSIKMSGYIEDLDSIDGEKLYEYYKEVLKKDLMDIFVIGNIDTKEIEKLIKSKFNIKTFKKSRKPYYVKETKPRLRRRFVT